MARSKNITHSKNLVDVFMESLVAPIQGIILSLLVYIANLVITTIQNATPRTPFTNEIIISPNMYLAFLAFLVVALTARDAILDFSESYREISAGVVKIFGTICGTLVFWQVLILITKIIGGSQTDVIFATILAIGAPLIGILIRVYLSNRRGVTNNF